jgi:hypothetical protein
MEMLILLQDSDVIFVSSIIRSVIAGEYGHSIFHLFAATMQKNARVLFSLFPCYH